MSVNWERHDPHYHEDDDYYEDFLPDNLWRGIRNGLLMTIPFWILGGLALWYAIHKFQHLAVR